MNIWDVFFSFHVRKTHILLKQESVHKNDPWFDIVHNTCPKPKTANSIITQHKKII